MAKKALIVKAKKEQKFKVREYNRCNIENDHGEVNAGIPEAGNYISGNDGDSHLEETHPHDVQRNRVHQPVSVNNLRDNGSPGRHRQGNQRAHKQAADQ